MNQIDNPFQSPQSDNARVRVGGIKWRPVVVFNASVFGAFVLLVAISAAWSWLQSMQMEQTLGRRYAAYDHEYSVHVNWVACAAMVGAIFVIANIGFFVLGPLLRAQLSADSSQNE